MCKIAHNLTLKEIIQKIITMNLAVLQIAGEIFEKFRLEFR